MWWVQPLLWSLPGNCGRLDLPAGGGNFDPTGSMYTAIAVRRMENNGRAPEGEKQDVAATGEKQRQ